MPVRTKFGLPRRITDDSNWFFDLIILKNGQILIRRDYFEKMGRLVDVQYSEDRKYLNLTLETYDRLRRFFPSWPLVEDLALSILAK